MVLKGKKWSKNVQCGLKWSSMVPNGPKWSTKINHKFNRMAFITRFNLVLVWSKIVQIFTKNSSKWVRHNQVSWSRNNEKKKICLKRIKKSFTKAIFISNLKFGGKGSVTQSINQLINDKAVCRTSRLHRVC